MGTMETVKKGEGKHMIRYYDLTEASEIDISGAIKKHSADQLIVYKQVDNIPIFLGFYFPIQYSTNRTYPLCIFVHGGGWTSHKVFEEQSCWQGDYLGYLARYYADKGYVCVSIDYRLAKGNGQAERYGILDCYEDCCDAVDYVLSNKDEYAIDTEKMYLLGESAGGWLAGGLATFHYDKKYKFRKTFLINPITHMYDVWGKYVPLESVHPFLKKMTLEEKQSFLSPLCQIYREMGDCVVIHGMQDCTVNPEHSILFYKRMQSAGKSCELHLLEKTEHAFLLPEYYDKGLEACKTAICILNQELLDITSSV